MEKGLKKTRRWEDTVFFHLKIPLLDKDLCSSTTSCFRVSEISSPKNMHREEWTEKNLAWKNENN
jgi:hypothetical protein